MLGHKASLNTFKKTKLHQAWDSCSSRKEQEQVTGALAPLEGGRGGSLNKVMVGVDPWVPLEAWLRWLPTCLVVLCVGVIAQYPVFAPSPSEVAVGLWRFCILLFINALTVPECSYF